MTIELLLALTLFAFVSVITPGPNNIMLMASGANFGPKRSLPHMFGVGLGFPIMLILVGIGVMAVFDRVPYSYAVLKVCSALYLCYLAYKIATAGMPSEGDAGRQPLTFVQASLFQWVNPKAWTMAVGAISRFAPAGDYRAILLVAVTFVLTGVISTTTWVMLGTTLRHWLDRPLRLRFFNGTMAVLLLTSLLPALH